eukprot:6203808-Pleurochrysis_carterae.AAC.1
MKQAGAAITSARQMSVCRPRRQGLWVRALSVGGRASGVSWNLKNLLLEQTYKCARNPNTGEQAWHVKHKKCFRISDHREFRRYRGIS